MLFVAILYLCIRMLEWLGEKIWRSIFFGSIWDGTWEAGLIFFGGFMTLFGFSHFY